MIYRITKRFLDIIFSIVLIILFIPLWVIIPIIIKIGSPGRVIFKQKRCAFDTWKGQI